MARKKLPPFEPVVVGTTPHTGIRWIAYSEKVLPRMRIAFAKAVARELKEHKKLIAWGNAQAARSRKQAAARARAGR